MKSSIVVLDHLDGITFDRARPPFANFEAFASTAHGVHWLARLVRECEKQHQANKPELAWSLVSAPPSPILPSAFNWFAVTLVNYMRLVALVQKMNAEGWGSDALVEKRNRDAIKKHCGDYVEGVIPEILHWRHKVAAHFAATDPWKDDNLGTIEQSVMGDVQYIRPHFFVGLARWARKGELSSLRPWAVTSTYNRLVPRYWPELASQE
ncbi:hypothetical protein LK996_15640 [Lysobacter sp. A6]|uniref:Uncharacterized protein n=1 Tax=Noviluteimonas lactosilytica TaxID=2888523 RepID=A0ABS8JLM1_9GAMM|nr:hypothetical protein [Lysobacter lactosilyticus]MCC8364504.1 hypothetical protein [Lysobacter lactosilyticus]